MADRRRNERREKSMQPHRILVLAVAAVATSALITVPATGSTTSTPQNGRIAFAKAPDEGALFTMNPDGTDVARLGKGEFAQFSADGDRVSFACDNGDHVAACVAGADGTNVTKIVPDTSGMANPPVDFYPTGWSPDGQLLLVDAGAGLSTTAAGIYTMRPDGSDLTRLTSTSTEQIPYGYSPDGSKILYLQADGDVGDLFVINADGSGKTRINPPDLDTTCCLPPDPDWSPDGQSIVFPAFDRINKWGDGIALYIAAADGSSLRRLTPSGQFSLQPAWSPDGTWIAYQKAGGFGWPKVKLVHPDGSSRHDITSPSQGLGGDMVWSPDSQRLMVTYAERPDYQFDIWTMRKDGTDLRQLTDTRAFDEALDWGVAP
jgi:Tol biopolymer transport system component